MKRIKLFGKWVSTLFGKKIGKLKHYFLAGIFCLCFLALFVYLLGIITNTVISALSWFNLDLIYSVALLLGFILGMGLIINIFGGQKFAKSNSFLIIMARSFMKLAEKSKTKNGFRSYIVPLGGLVGVDPIMQLELVKSRLEIKTLKLRKEHSSDWMDYLLDSKEFLRYEELLKKLENGGGKSASICVFSGEEVKETKMETDGLWSTTPSIITGFPFFDIPLENAKEIDTKIAVSEVTSGTFGK